MKKLILFITGILFILCLSSFISAVDNDDILNKQKFYYSMNNNSGTQTDSSVYNQDATLDGTTFIPEGKINGAYLINGVANSHELTINDLNRFDVADGGSFEIVYWYNTSSEALGGDGTQAYWWDAGAKGISASIGESTGLVVDIRGGSGNCQMSNSDFSGANDITVDNNWHIIFVGYNGTTDTCYAYYGNETGGGVTLIGSQVSNIGTWSVEANFLFPRSGSGNGDNTMLDEFMFLNTTLSQAEREYLYGGGDGVDLTDNAPPQGEGVLDIILKTPLSSTYNSTPNQNLVFEYTTQNKTTAETCRLYTNESGSWEQDEYLTSPAYNTTLNITHLFTEGIYIWNVGCNLTNGTIFFDSSNFTLRIDLTAPTLTSNITNYYSYNQTIEINFTDNILIKNITVVDSCSLNFENLSVSATHNYYNHNSTILDCGLGTKQTNATVCDYAGNCYNESFSWENMGLLNISAFYSIDNTIINNFSVYINNTFIGDATNGSLLASNLTGDINITIDAPQYALTSEVYSITKTIDAYNMSVYGTNSISITIIDEVLNTPIYSNISIRFTGGGSVWINITNTSTFYIENLNTTNYTLQFYSDDYATRTYMITVGDRTTQNLDAYMISEEHNTIFTITDQDTAASLSGVSFGIYKQSGVDWALISSTLSDITGKVKFYYDPLGSYQFYLTKEGYENLIFYLNPIIFSSYNLQMEKSILLNYSFNLDGIAIVYGPQTFNNTQVTNFTFLINSPYGSLINYGINLTYPGGSNYVTGSNAVGGGLNALINISNASVFDVVHLEYFYTTTIAGRRDFSANFPITFPEGTGTNTFMVNKNKTFGMGIFERILIATLIAIFIVGMASLTGHPLPGLALNLFIQSYLTYIGLIPIWITLPSLLLGVLIIIWKSGGT